jgi:hydrogen peroxide-dependent heme synthase
VTEELIFASYPVFKVRESLEESERDIAAKEAQALLDEVSDSVQTRGVYTTTGFGAGNDLMMWWVANSPDDVQDLLTRFQRTQLGRSLTLTESFLGLVRPAEFARDHLPAFVKGETPKKYACVYPFVRTPDWYLLDPKERGQLLRLHGEVGREYGDVLANTTSAFGLGDYEWILAFEADGVERIVELIRALRATEARRFTKVEIPFVTGIRRDLADAVVALP